MKQLLVFVAALLAAQVVVAQEQERKFYVFGQVGSASIDFNTANNDAALRGAGAIGLTSTVNDTAAAVLIGAGFKFNPHASIELGFLKVADYTYKASFAQGTATETISGSGVGVNLVGYLPVAEKVNVYGKLGIWSFSIDDKATISAAGFAQASESSTNTTPMIGLGIEFKVTPEFGIRAEYDHFNKIGDDATLGSSKLDYLSVGLAVSF
jgi:opacity protein-like surface antigen